MLKINKKVLALLITVLFIIPLFAESAVVTYVKGKVEISSSEGWVPVKVGDIINTSSTISTGFQAEARVEYNGSVMALGALTRITLENLASTASKDDVSVYLSTGAVRSKVTHTQNKRVAYTVKSPIAVASVRGTDFTVTAGGTISCREGAVAVYANKETKKAKASKKAVKEKEENEDEEDADGETDVSETEVAPEVDNSPATATTPADEIDEKAPIGAIVVGKNQEVTFKVTGNPETPMINAIKKSEKVVNTVTTAAAQESVNMGSSSTVINIPELVEQKPEVEAVVEPSSIVLTVVLED